MIARLSWPTAVAVGVAALAVVAMFFDHMLDVEEPFPADAPAFVISVALILVLAAVVFGVVVRRTTASPAPADLAGKRGLVCSILSVLTLPGIWLGLPEGRRECPYQPIWARPRTRHHGVQRRLATWPVIALGPLTLRR